MRVVLSVGVVRLFKREKRVIDENISWRPAERRFYSRDFSLGKKFHIDSYVVEKGKKFNEWRHSRIQTSLEGGSAAHSWPPVSPKWLEFQAGIILMDQWHPRDMSDI